MTFEEIVDQAVDMVRRRGQMSYRMLKRQFDIDDDVLEDLKEELLFAHPQIRDEEGRGLVWTEEVEETLSSVSRSSENEAVIDGKLGRIRPSQKEESHEAQHRTHVDNPHRKLAPAG